MNVESVICGLYSVCLFVCTQEARGLSGLKSRLFRLYLFVTPRFRSENRISESHVSAL